MISHFILPSAFVLFLSCVIQISVVGVSADWEWWHPKLPSVRENELQNTVFLAVTGSFSSDLTSKLGGLLQATLIRGSKSGFLWQKSTAFREHVNGKELSWMVFSGWQPQFSRSNAFTSASTGVVACQVLPTDLAAFGLSMGECQVIELSKTKTHPKRMTSESGAPSLKLNSTQSNSFFIMELTSLELEPKFNGALLVYCDPLWQADNMHPGGRCRLRLRKEGKWINLNNYVSLANSDIQFCTTSLHSVPCLGGYSIAVRQVLSEESTSVPNIEVLVGLPYSKVLGEVLLFSDILNPEKRTNTLRMVGINTNFGINVIWAQASAKSFRQRIGSPASSNPWLHDNLALVASADLLQPRVVSVRHVGDHLALHGIIEPPSRNHSTRRGLPLHGFGFSLETVYLPILRTDNASGDRTDYGIIVGSPFEGNATGAPNVGRVYLVCPSTSDEVDLGSQFSTVHGRRDHEFFGYSIANIGDIDGDGIDEVAIGAPALLDIAKSGDVDAIYGRVYIYKIMDNCRFHSEPLQILKAHDSQAGDGFGISVARGVDLDADSWPELIISTLRYNVPPYIFTMPRRLRAVCQLNGERSFSITPIQVGDQIPLVFTVRLFDTRTNQIVQIPIGVQSTQLRIHQINPDVLLQKVSVEITQKHYSKILSEDDLDTFFLSRNSVGDDHFSPSTKPRFQLVPGVPIRTKLMNHASSMLVMFTLQAQLGVQVMDFASIPLVIAYRSMLNREACDNNANDQYCFKHQQPLIDWSQCQSQLELMKHICVPRTKCSADLLLMELPQLYQSGSLDTFEGNQKNDFEHGPVYGTPLSRRFRWRFRLLNNGPTKSTGVRLYLKVLGHEFAGFKLHINRIQQDGSTENLQDESKLANVGMYRHWLVYITEDGTVALIKSRAYEWVYPNQHVDIEVVMFAEEVNSETGKNAHQNGTGSFDFQPPGLTVQVKSGIHDPELTNNRINLFYHTIYRPNLVITTGDQPSSVLDRRKKPIVFQKETYGRRVLGSDLGPKISHTYLIENRGHSTLTNLTFVLKIPVALDNGDFLVYLLDQFRRRKTIGDKFVTSVEYALPEFLSINQQQVGQCYVPDGSYNQQRLSILVTEQDGIYRSEESPTWFEYGKDSLQRVKRTSTDTDIVISRIYQTRGEGVSGGNLTTHSNTTRAFERLTNRIFTVDCPSNHRVQPIQSTPIRCLEVRCKLKKLSKGDAVRLRWIGWIWAETFFKLREPDLKLSSSLHLESWGPLPKALSVYVEASSKGQTNQPNTQVVQLEIPKTQPSWNIEQSVVFLNVRRRHLGRLPWWPIVVGVMIGFLLVAFMITLLHWCGCFRRHDRAQSEILTGDEGFKRHSRKSTRKCCTARFPKCHTVRCHRSRSNATNCVPSTEQHTLLKDQSSDSLY